MDETDDQILAQLRSDARTPVAALAKQLGLARSTVQTRIERLERAGVIAGYTLRLGDASERPRIRATALLQIEPRTLPAVLTRLKALRQIESVHTTSGRFDLIVAIVGATTDALDRTLDEIGAVPGVRSSESLIHLSTRIDRAV